MPTPIKRTRTPQSTESPETATTAKPQPSPSAFVRKVFESVLDDLKSEFQSFVKDSTIEEKRFLYAILNEHQRHSHFGEPRNPSDYEIGLYSAIEYQASQCRCVTVPDDDMVPLVNDFIASLDRKMLKRKAATEKANGPDDLRGHLAERSRTDLELFLRDAGVPSQRMMLDILARWNEIAIDPVANKAPCLLAAAVDIELSKWKAEQAATAAVKPAA